MDFDINIVTLMSAIMQMNATSVLTPVFAKVTDTNLLHHYKYSDSKRKEERLPGLLSLKTKIRTQTIN